MIGKKIQDAFNGQINAETFSAYLYWSMAAYFDSINLPGFAHWMRVQGQEEMAHAAKFYEHIVERGGRVMLAALEAPATEWDSPLAAFEAACEHERSITKRIHDLADLSAAQKDHAAANFLQWFISEQVEEEAGADQVVQKLKLAGKSAGAMLYLDHEMAERKRSGGD